MKKTLIAVGLLPIWIHAASFTDFYVQTDGSNLNSGDTNATTALFTAASGYWTNSTGVFYKSGLNPAAGGVEVGRWASVYPDGYTNTYFIGLITARDDTADSITVSLTAVAGTPPATDAVGATTIKVGGAWAGPATGRASTNENFFPFGFVAATTTNASGYCPRVNFKAQTYSVTNQIYHNLAGPVIFSGYTTSPNDGGRATIDGGGTGASYVVLTIGTTGDNTTIQDFVFNNNGATGTSEGVVTLSGTVESVFNRCVFSNMRGTGLATSDDAYVIECEAFGNNEDNVSTGGGFGSTDTTYVRCISHDNTPSNSKGFRLGSGVNAAINCVAESNGDDGFAIASTSECILMNCDAYANGGDGADLGGTSAVMILIENCNFVLNTGYGINSSGSTIRNAIIQSCGFGSGTKTNSAGIIAANFSGIQAGVLTNSFVLYAADTEPWADAADGNFRITLSAAKNAGIGSFLQTQSGYGDPTPTLSYPDIGAGQATVSGGATSHVWAQ